MLATSAMRAHAQSAPPASGSTPTAPAVDPMTEALGHEDARRWPQAAAAYRVLLERAMGDPDGGDMIALALLGLERVWAEAALRDSVLPVVEQVLRARPSDPVARSIQFRSLSVAAREDDLRRAFEAWRRADPADAAPWREYLRTLLEMGRVRGADSVLIDARRLLGRQADLAGEAAQIMTSLERWIEAAHAWREAMEVQPWTETAASFALQRVPAAARDSVRSVLRNAPVTVPVRRLLSTLELTWGEPRRGWDALAELARDDSTAAAMEAYGTQVEALGAWSVAREVWRTLYASRRDVATGVRAAQAALAAGDAAAALALVDELGRGMPDGERASRTLSIAVQALGALGRAREASERVERAAPLIDDSTRADLAPLLVSAWLRVGDVARARAVAERAGALDDDATLGWLALYEGDLAEARRRLVRTSALATRDRALTDALAMLARTRAERSEPLGAAFLALARRDTSDAIARFATLATGLPDVAPVALALAARLASTGRTADAAMRYWGMIATDHATSPEAPEALLELARAHARGGDRTAAIARYETLLLEHAGSALVPQARRELAQLRGQVPPSERQEAACAG
jgi:tetratricopeptide (TPR) repeat protein